MPSIPPVISPFITSSELNETPACVSVEDIVIDPFDAVNIAMPEPAFKYEDPSDNFVKDPESP
jgi:hypothetical protein